jgi:hypothetical protein
MALDARHPSYVDRAPDWELLRDAQAGERAVKTKGFVYLPPTSGMWHDGMQTTEAPGYRAYAAYRTRAVFPDFVSEAVGHMLGLMHARPAKIELPAQLEPMRAAASSQGETLQHLLMRINQEQLVTGRLGLMLDLPEGKRQGVPRMFLSLYPAETILNWDENLVGGDRTVLNLVVLDESRYERRPGLDWDWVERYRVLSLGPIETNEVTGVYGQALSDTKDIPTSLLQPSIQGRTLDRIPWAFINTKDNLSEPDRPPLLGLARLCMTIYRGEADYRQNLFMQGQDTFVTIGAPDTGEDGERVGAGAMINLPAGADAKYVGVQSQGLSEQRQALETDRAMAAQRAGQLATAKSKQIESGEALQTRIASVTASLTSIAKSGAAGLEQLLRQAAEWVGADPDQVKVEPNLQFQDLSFNPRDIVELASARAMGAPLSRKSFHAVLKERGFTRLEYDEEIREIEEEEPLTAMDGTMGDLPADGPPSGGDTSGGSASAAAASGAN